MYPNPQDVLPLPSRPDLEHYRRRAKDLAKASRSGAPGAVHEWAAHWVADLARLAPDAPAPSASDTDRRVRQIAEFAHVQLTRAGGALSEAQFIVARAHGFQSWPKLVQHLEQLSAEDTGVSAFERAADAIVRGDRATLERLLAADPGLARARSTREHNATLLHYVAANGVENYRQVTPPNIVDIARALLDAGADVNAEADVYGGGATTLALVVTSAHPRHMKVQDALADLLLDRGARMDDPVRSCLMNGCPEAAAHLVARGAPVNTMEEAAGLGRLDLLQDMWDRGGAVPTARVTEAEKALRMAAWYGRADVATFLLERGIGPEARDDKDGDTALHVASYNGHPELVRLLLRAGADVHAIDAVYRTPPIAWALHAWLAENRRTVSEYREIVGLLLDAGAQVHPGWIDDKRLRADPNRALRDE